MHDPDTVAFEIKSPFRGPTSEVFPRGLRKTLVTIYHRDPCRDGSDNSCGWSGPKLTAAQAKRLDGLAFGEAREPWFRASEGKHWDGSPADAEALIRGAIVVVAECLGLRLRWPEACRLASELSHWPGNNFRDALCYLDGYHSNAGSSMSEKWWREDRAGDLFRGIARAILRDRRPWWRHPRFHVWHWRVQVPPYQAFVRWATARPDAASD